MLEGEIEHINQLHLAAVAKARSTNLDMDWNEAQSIERLGNELKGHDVMLRKALTKLSLLESFAVMMIKGHPDSLEVKLFKSVCPEICKKLGCGDELL